MLFLLLSLLLPSPEVLIRLATPTEVLLPRRVHPWLLCTTMESSSCDAESTASGAAARGPSQGWRRRSLGDSSSMMASAVMR